MPELPEVETLKRELGRAIVDKTIKKLESERFKLDLAGRKILAVKRRAKVLILKLGHSRGSASGNLKAEPRYLLVHLKMTGQLVYSPHPSPPQRGGKAGVSPSPLGRGPGGGAVVGGHPADPAKHTRAVFHFTDGSKLLFNDLRKFGWLKLVNETELQKILGETGVEPLSKQFALEKFTELLRRYPRRKIKQLLLDQTIIAGLGNIYVDESCFLAGLRPERMVGSLTSNKIKSLHAAIVAVLKHAIRKKGTSARNYRRVDGRPGGFVPHLNVYGRAGELCKTCGTPIAKIKLNGRGTHFCPRCQK